jgi:hypothetical protein
MIQVNGSKETSMTSLRRSIETMRRKTPISKMRMKRSFVRFLIATKEFGTPFLR